MNITDFPLEVLEHILLYLDIPDLNTWLITLENMDGYSNSFWKKLCQKYDCDPDEYNFYKDCYIHCANLKLARYNVIKTPLITIRNHHTYKSMILVGSFNNLQLWKLCDGKFEMLQCFRPGKVIAFGKILVIKSRSCFIDVFTLNDVDGIYEKHEQIQYDEIDMIAVNDKLVVIFSHASKYFMINDIYKGTDVTTSLDTAIVLSIVLNNHKVFVVNCDNNQKCKINVYDMESNSWVMEMTYNYSGNRNTPMIAVSNYYILLTSPICRAHGSVMFDDLKVWTHSGTVVRSVNLNISRAQIFLCCFWKDKIFTVVTDESVGIMDKNTYDIMKLINPFVSWPRISNLQAGPANMLFVNTITGLYVYDWKVQDMLYSLVLNFGPGNRYTIYFNKLFMHFMEKHEELGIVLHFGTNQMKPASETDYCANKKYYDMCYFHVQRNRENIDVNCKAAKIL